MSHDSKVNGFSVAIMEVWRIQSNICNMMMEHSYQLIYIYLYSIKLPFTDPHLNKEENLEDNRWKHTANGRHMGNPKIFRLY